MKSDKEILDITKWNGDNYGAWNLKLRFLLVYKGLWEVV